MKGAGFMIILAPLLLLCACQVQAGDTTNEVKLAVGQTYTIDLDSNPTTGYSWRLASPTNKVFMLVTNTYEPRANNQRLVGSGGVEHWTFKAVGKGRAELALEYVRPWEKVTVNRKDVTIVCE
jgi:inhibitor of cysteine peptidase